MVRGSPCELEDDEVPPGEANKDMAADADDVDEDAEAVVEAVGGGGDGVVPSGPPVTSTQ